MHRIENEFMAVVAREYGAELISLWDKKHRAERLWQADPEFWAWHAPVLFPVIGRCWNDRIKIDGRYYDMPKHGFARKSVFRLLDSEDDRLVFSLSATPETLTVYPYVFELLIRYRLEGKKLHCSYEVINKDKHDMFFSLGAHPAFAVPVLGGTYEDYFLVWDQPEKLERHFINQDGFFDGRTEVLYDRSAELALAQDMFREDALIFKKMNTKRVTLKSRANHLWLSVSFDGFDYLGLWAKTGAPFLCIEPWLGCADTAGIETELSAKEGILRLAPQQKLIKSVSFEIGG